MGGFPTMDLERTDLKTREMTDAAREASGEAHSGSGTEGTESCAR